MFYFIPFNFLLVDASFLNPLFIHSATVGPKLLLAPPAPDTQRLINGVVRSCCCYREESHYLLTII